MEKRKIQEILTGNKGNAEFFTEFEGFDPDFCYTLTKFMSCLRLSVLDRSCNNVTDLVRNSWERLSKDEQQSLSAHLSLADIATIGIAHGKLRIHPLEVEGTIEGMHSSSDKVVRGIRSKDELAAKIGDLIKAVKAKRASGDGKLEVEDIE